MTAAEVLAAVERLDEELAWRRAGPWLGARAPITAARELLTVAASASPMHRMVALSLVAGLDDGALPAWREAAELPRVGPAARAFLAREFGEPEPTAQDARWQVVDESVALLDEEGVAGALSDIWDNLPGDDADTKIISVEGAGHPDAGRLIEELRWIEWDSKAARSSIPGVTTGTAAGTSQPRRPSMSWWQRCTPKLGAPERSSRPPTLPSSVDQARAGTAATPHR